jgi:hypothetical protein
MRAALAAVAILAALTGCGSPEATRMRAGGPGADVGNHRGEIALHEGSQPYYRTPTRGQGLLPRPERGKAVAASPAR